LEGTTEETNDMEEDDDGLAPILFGAIPSNIEKFTSNKQWHDDLARDLPKQRYGIKLKISPKNAPTETDTLPMYHHIRIFKAMATAILTARQEPLFVVSMAKKNQSSM
jgi:hypothetical protein